MADDQWWRWLTPRKTCALAAPRRLCHTGSAMAANAAAPRRTTHNSIKSFILICLSRACPDGEIGRRSGLKIRRPQGRGGSSPPLGTKDKTIKINNLQRHEPLTTGRRLRCPNSSGAGSSAGFYLVCCLRPRRTKTIPRKVVRKERGVFEKEPGSGIWWVRYYIDGRERREKAGRRGDAIKLYKLRKTDALRGVKLPTNMKHKGVRFKVIAQEAIAWYIDHNRKDVRNFKSRMKYILKTFGDHVADEMKPSDIDTWIGAQKWSAATKNRYKNVFGKTFKIALGDGKVTGNPARLVEQRPENNTRIRYLLDDEGKSLRKAASPRSTTKPLALCSTGLQMSQL
jgi:hypothetical protein